MTAVTFPTWARIALGLLVAFVGFLLTGGVFTVDDDARTAIGALVALLASVGIVPPRPGDLPPMSQVVRLLLIAVVIVATYFVQQIDSDTLRGVIQAVVLLAASVGIVPPQAAAGPPQPNLPVSSTMSTTVPDPGKRQ